MSLRIFAIVFPIFALVAASYAYGRWRRPDVATVNRLNLELAIPAFVLDILMAEDFHLADYGPLALGGAAVVLGSGLIALPVARMARVQAKTLIPPMMFTNAGNLGLPLAVFAYGAVGLPAATLLFLVEMALHFTLGMYLMDRRAPWREIVMQPIVVATLVGLGLGVFSMQPPAPVTQALHLLGQAAIPLMLIALGVRLADADWRDWRVGMLGALLCPAAGVVVVLLVRPWLALDPVQSGLLLLFGALPPAVMNFLVAERYRQEPGRVATIVLLGNLAAVVVIPIALAFALPE